MWNQLVQREYTVAFQNRNAVVKKLCNLQYATAYLFLKANMYFFTSVDSSYYSFYYA